MVKIFVDHREQKSIVKELVKAKIDVEMKQLAVADFVLETKNLDGKVLTVGIERKTQHDFLNSIIDKRIFNQLLLLRQQFDVPLLLIEGTENLYALRDFHPNAIRGILATIMIDLQVHLVYTQNVRDTAHMLSIIASRLEKKRSPLVLNAKPKMASLREQQEFLIAALPGVGSMLAKNLLQKMKSIKNIVNASEEELRDVEKIGKIKASQIRRVFDGEYPL